MIKQFPYKYNRLNSYFELYNSFNLSSSFSFIEKRLWTLKMAYNTNLNRWKFHPENNSNKEKPVMLKKNDIALS